MKRNDEFEELLRDAAREYHRPPETPREVMWERIVAERRARKLVRASFGARHRWAWLSAAAAALLLIGIGIGRQLQPAAEREMSETTLAGLDSSQSFTAVEPSTAYRIKMSSHFSRADVLLTQFNSMNPAVDTDAEFEGWARGLLTDTQLLLESPATSNAEYRALLEDLEFVLVQIVHASTTRRSEERRWIAEGLLQRGVMERLRLLTPDSPGT